MTTLYKVNWLNPSGEAPNSIGVRLVYPAPVDFPPCIPYTYSEYVQATNSNPQMGDVIVVDEEWKILGLHAELVDADRN